VRRYGSGSYLGAGGEEGKDLRFYFGGRKEVRRIRI
jgi:hypothetical protein